MGFGQTDLFIYIKEMALILTKAVSRLELESNLPEITNKDGRNTFFSFGEYVIFPLQVISLKP